LVPPASAWLTLLCLRTFVRVTLVAALVLRTHAMYDSFAVIRWSEAAIRPATMGVLWSESVAGEVLVFLLIGPTLLRLMNPTGALAGGILRALGGYGSNDRSSGACIGSTAARIHLCAPPPRIHAHHHRHRTALAGTARTVYGLVGATGGSGWLYARLDWPHFGDGSNLHCCFSGIRMVHQALSTPDAPRAYRLI
jgi:hypothetical protein